MRRFESSRGQSFFMQLDLTCDKHHPQYGECEGSNPPLGQSFFMQPDLTCDKHHPQYGECGGSNPLVDNLFLCNLTSPVINITLNTVNAKVRILPSDNLFLCNLTSPVINITLNTVNARRVKSSPWTIFFSEIKKLR